MSSGREPWANCCPRQLAGSKVKGLKLAPQPFYLQSTTDSLSVRLNLRYCRPVGALRIGEHLNLYPAILRAASGGLV
ncbi:MAG: hypothetical protein JWM54_1943 [Acidobacteriaceae bacterium]|nr:hypothetical protein [Acidobacteriaceae bacterium]